MIMIKRNSRNERITFLTFMNIPNLMPGHSRYVRYKGSSLFLLSSSKLNKILFFTLVFGMYTILDWTGISDYYQ